MIVYTDMRGVDADIYYWALSTHTEVQVTVAVGDQELSDVSDGIIVYTDLLRRDILVYSTLTGKTSDITSSNSYSSINPATSDGLVAWEDDRDGNVEIYARNLATGEERRVSDSPDRDVNPAVNQGVIVWQRCNASGICDIMTYDWNTGVTTQVTNTVDGDERNPHVYQGTVVYDALRNGERNICSYNLGTAQERCLNLLGDQGNPHISGDFVSFEDSVSGVPHISL